MRRWQQSLRYYKGSYRGDHQACIKFCTECHTIVALLWAKSVMAEQVPVSDAYPTCTSASMTAPQYAAPAAGNSVVMSS